MVQLYVWDITWFAELSKKDALMAWMKTYAKKWIFQYEDGTECDPEAKKVTPHFQGRMSLHKKVTPRALITMLGPAFFGLHLSPTSRNAAEKGWSYVMKGKPVAGPWKDEGDEPEEAPSAVVEWESDDVKDGTYQARPFQQMIENMIVAHKELTNAVVSKDRIVNWIFDPTGGQGKGWLVRRLEHKGLATCVPPMDMEKIMGFLISLKTANAYLIDLPRAQPEKSMKSMLAGLEMLKDGRLYDWRYKGKTRTIRPPAIWVFSNQEPDMSLLTINRWNVWTINAAFELVPHQVVIPAKSAPQRRSAKRKSPTVRLDGSEFENDPFDFILPTNIAQSVVNPDGTIG